MSQSTGHCARHCMYKCIFKKSCARGWASVLGCGMFMNVILMNFETVETVSTGRLRHVLLKSKVKYCIQSNAEYDMKFVPQMIVLKKKKCIFIQLSGFHWAGSNKFWWVFNIAFDDPSRYERLNSLAHICIITLQWVKTISLKWVFE